MYCIFCGKELPDEFKFCPNCGHASAFTAKKTDKETEHSYETAENVLCRVLGALFIVGGVLPYFLRIGDVADNNLVYAAEYGMYFFKTYIFLRNILNFFSSVFNFTPSALSLVCGILLLKRAGNMYNGLKVCMITHIVSLVYYGLAYLFIFAFPGMAVSLFDNDRRVVEAAVQLMGSEHDFLSYYKNIILLRTIISFILIALAITFLCLKRYIFTNSKKYNSKINTLGIYLMLPMLHLFEIIASYTVYYHSTMWGEFHAQASSFAISVFEYYLSTICAFLIIIFLAVVLLLNKKAKWFVPLSAAGVVVIIFGIAFIFSDPIMHELALPAEIDVITVILYRYSLIGYAAMLIAAFVWFYAVAKGTLPKRLQIVVPIMLPFIFILESIVMWKLDIPYQFSMIGHLGVSAIIILVSVFVKKKIKVENKE